MSFVKAESAGRRPEEAAAEPPVAADSGGFVGEVIPSKEDNLSYCLHNVIACDISPLPPICEFDAFTRDNAQLFVNRIFQLPVEDCDDGLFAKLSGTASFPLPRIRPIPKPKPKTRWEKFAEAQGIKKRKRSRLVWDDLKSDWVPRYGHGSVKKNREAAEGILEVKDGEDPYEDKFEKRSNEKALVKGKQKLRELRNRAEAASKGGAGSGAGTAAETSTLVFDGRRGRGKLTKAQLAEAMRRAQTSTASFGRFDPKAEKEETPFMLGRQRVSRKVKGAALGSAAEQSANTSLCRKVLSKISST